MTAVTISEGAPQRMRRRSSRPYHMRGRPEVTEERKTSVDPPDRRIPQVHVAPLPAGAIRRISQQFHLDPRFRSTDRWFIRWAATPGTGVAIPRLSRPHYALIAPDVRITVLNDVESQLTDIAVRTAPRWAQMFVMLWYRSERSVTEIAETLHIKRRSEVYRERELALSHFGGRLAQMGFELALWDTARATEA